MSNTSKQPMIRLRNRNETSSQWTNQLITLQRVFSAFPQQMWYSVGPLMPFANATWGVICSSTCWLQMRQHPQSPQPDTLQVLGSAPGSLRGQTWFQPLRDPGARRVPAGLFIWFRKEKSPLLQNKEWKASPWAWTCSWLHYFTYIVYNA